MRKASWRHSGHLVLWCCHHLSQDPSYWHIGNRVSYSAYRESRNSSSSIDNSSLPLSLCHLLTTHVYTWARFTKGFSIAIQIRWKFLFHSHLDFNTVIATNFCTWQDSSAVVACAKFCCDLMANNRITARRSFHQIWNADIKPLLKRIPVLIFVGLIVSVNIRMSWMFRAIYLVSQEGLLTWCLVCHE